MLAVVKSAGATTANRALELVVQSSNGILVDPSAASFQIFDTTDSSKEETPVQVYPGSGAQALNLVTSKIGTGRYAATWIPGSIGYGRYMVRWTFTVSGVAQQFDQEFELVPVPYIGPNYCSVYDLIGAGYEGEIAEGQKRIVRASRYIEHYTGRRFLPQYKAVRVTGRRGRALHLEEPIIAIDALNIDYSGLFTDLARDTASYTVFNRHITQNLLAPDDRENPKLEFLHAGYNSGYFHREEYRPAVGLNDYRFSGGVQNVKIAGLFGYTEPDGTMTGATPQLIRWACQKLVMAEVQNEEIAASTSSGVPAVNPSRIKSVYSRDQGFILFEPTGETAAAPVITHIADPEVDAILFNFRRPPRMGAV